jgi:hypothetical protein
MSCLETAMVRGKRRVPDPPARMMPLRFIFFDSEANQLQHDLSQNLDGPHFELKFYTKALARIFFFRDIGTPAPMAQVPIHGLLDTGIKIFHR